MGEEEELCNNPRVVVEQGGRDYMAWDNAQRTKLVCGLQYKSYKIELNYCQ